MVDDNATNRQLLITLLSGWGCHYATAPDGPTALALMKEAKEHLTPFKIALLDHHMPGMDGMTLAGLIKGTPDLADTMLVMLTSLGNRGDGATMQKAGFSAFLTKPVRQQQLHDCLSLLAGRGLADEDHIVEKNLITRHTLNEAKKHSARILLAEDNPVNQAVGISMLKKLGYRVDVVANGLEALESLSRIPYDIVLMDCQMPEMDGYEATAAIRDPGSRVINHSVPVIAMTANAMKGDKDRCIGAGMDDHIAKPVKKETLGAMLDKWLGTRVKPLLNPHDDQTEAENSDKTDNGILFNAAELLDRCENIQELFYEVLGLALADLPRRISNLEKAIAEEDRTGIRDGAHAIKGMAANLSAKRLKAITSEMQDSADSATIESLKAMFAEAELQTRLLIEAIESAKAEMPQTA